MTILLVCLSFCCSFVESNKCVAIKFRRICVYSKNAFSLFQILLGPNAAVSGAGSGGVMPGFAPR